MKTKIFRKTTYKKSVWSQLKLITTFLSDLLIFWFQMHELSGETKFNLKSVKQKRIIVKFQSCVTIVN